VSATGCEPARRNGATEFLNLETLEPYKDQWAYLSTPGRMTPPELSRAANRAGLVTVGAEVTQLACGARLLDLAWADFAVGIIAE
jgi:hypothetical protein